MRRTDRTIPPKRGRIAKAARAGIFPHSPALAAGTGLLAGSFMLALRGQETVSSLSAFLKGGIKNALVKPEAPEVLLWHSLLAGARLILPLLLVVFAASTIASLTPAIWARRHRGRTAVPLPHRPNPKLAFAAIRTFGLAVFLLLALKIVRDQPLGWSAFTPGDFCWTVPLSRILQRILFAGGIILMLVALTEMALMRHEILRALRLNSLESRREERAAGGDRAVKRETRRRGRRGRRELHS